MWTLPFICPILIWQRKLSDDMLRLLKKKGIWHRNGGLNGRSRDSCPGSFWAVIGTTVRYPFIRKLSSNGLFFLLSDQGYPFHDSVIFGGSALHPPPKKKKKGGGEEVGWGTGAVSWLNTNVSKVWSACDRSFLSLMILGMNANGLWLGWARSASQRIYRPSLWRTRFISDLQAWVRRHEKKLLFSL